MRKRILTTLALLAAPLAFASIVILFDPATGRNLRRMDRDSADTLAYMNRTDALINPVLPTNALNLCYVTNGQVLPIPQAWLDAEELANWLASSNASYQAIQSQNSNAFWLAMNFFSDNSNTVNLIVTATAMEMVREHNHWRTNFGLAPMSEFAALTKIISNVNYLRTNQ